MKKLIFSAMILTFLLCNVSYGAVSEDIYVRKDVFSAEMKNINSKLDFIIEEMKSQRQEIQAINTKLNDLEKSVAVLSARIDGVDARLGARIDGVDNRVGDFRNNVYLGLVLLGIFVAWPSIKDYFKWREERKSSPENIERLIEKILDAKLADLSNLPQMK